MSLINSILNTFFSKVPTFWIPYTMQVYTFILKIIHKIITQTNKTQCAIVNSFSDDTYVFYNGIDIPFKQTTSLDIGNYTVKWIYCNEESKFVHNTLDISGTKPTLIKPSWLSVSMTVRDNEYDLSSWIESLKFLTVNKIYPSWPILIVCWSINTSIKVSLNDEIKLTIINDDGDTEEIFPFAKTIDVVCGKPIIVDSVEVSEPIESLKNTENTENK
jgi:hypothetical protein